MENKEKDFRKCMKLKRLYPQGKKKAFNVTYDDGVVQDIRFVNLLNNNKWETISVVGKYFGSITILNLKLMNVTKN